MINGPIGKKSHELLFNLRGVAIIKRARLRQKLGIRRYSFTYSDVYDGCNLFCQSAVNTRNGFLPYRDHTHTLRMRKLSML